MNIFILQQILSLKSKENTLRRFITLRYINLVQNYVMKVLLISKSKHTGPI